MKVKEEEEKVINDLKEKYTGKINAEEYGQR
jgi:hypothetical protein